MHRVGQARPGRCAAGWHRGSRDRHPPALRLTAGLRAGMSATHAAIEAVWRIESARLIASLARIVRDVGVAEDLAQDALVAALEQWPESGVPENPGAWLMATAKHRAIDRLRHGAMAERKHAEIARSLELAEEPDLAAAIDDDIGDDLLSLIFIACHPVLSTDARVALTLRLVGALTTAEIARAFLTSEATVAQRMTTRALRPAGGDRGLPRPRAGGRGHRLGEDRRAVRRAGGADGLAGGGAQPGDGLRHGLRSRRRS